MEYFFSMFEYLSNFSADMLPTGAIRTLIRLSSSSGTAASISHECKKLPYLESCGGAGLLRLFAPMGDRNKKSKVSGYVPLFCLPNDY